MYMFFFYLYKVEELPFLLTRAGELDRLKDTVTKLDVFFRLSEDEDGVFELVKAWKTVSIVITPLHRWGGGGGGILFYLRPFKIFFVEFFSATIDGRNLIFGHKLHIGMPYCGKRFWTCQISTFCLPT